MKTVLYWAPRLLAIAAAIFLSIFALDIFGQGYSFWETVVGLFMHLLPTFLILAILFVAWKWEIPGGVLFVALALAFSLFFHNPWTVTLLLFGPLALTGLLFLLDAFYNRRLTN